MACPPFAAGSKAERLCHAGCYSWPMTKILLTRHGHVDGIRLGRFRGRAELALTEHGLAASLGLATTSCSDGGP